MTVVCCHLGNNRTIAVSLVELKETHKQKQKQTRTWWLCHFETKLSAPRQPYSYCRCYYATYWTAVSVFVDIVHGHHHHHHHHHRSNLLFIVVNGQYSSYKEHAKQQLQQQQYASILRSATIGQKINGNERTGRTPINGVNRLQSVEQESTLMRRGKTILDSDNNPNLDVGLLDVEPEANLFLDEISIKNLPKWSHNPKSGTHIVPHAIKSGGEVDRLSNNQESTAIDTR